jgi:hypothetical protein
VNGGSVPAAIVSPWLSRAAANPGQLPPQSRCTRARHRRKDTNEKDRLHPVDRDRRDPHHRRGCDLIVVSNTLADQKITVSDDASCLAGDEVNGPFSAYCEAMVIDKHALEATGGLRYAELDREDPKRQTAMTASFLQASLFTSVVAFGVAAMAIAVGVLFILIGLGIRDVASRIRHLASRTPATA